MVRSRRKLDTFMAESTTEPDWRNVAPMKIRTERIHVSLCEEGRAEPGDTLNRKPRVQMIWSFGTSSYGLLPCLMFRL